MIKADNRINNLLLFSFFVYFYPSLFFWLSCASPHQLIGCYLLTTSLWTGCQVYQTNSYLSLYHWSWHSRIWSSQKYYKTNPISLHPFLLLLCQSLVRWVGFCVAQHGLKPKSIMALTLPNCGRGNCLSSRFLHEYKRNSALHNISPI